MKLEKIQELNTEERIWSLDWHPTSQILATAGQSRKIKLWKLSQDQGWYLHEAIPTSHTKSIRCLKFSHSGKSLAVASFDATISIYHWTGAAYEELTLLEGHENQVKSVSWSPNDTKIASCSRDRNVWIWSYNSVSHDYECQAILEGHTDDVKTVIWLEEDCLASASYDESIRLWAEQDGQFGLFQELQGHTSTVWSLAYDNKAGILYSAGQDREIVQWRKDNSTGRFQKMGKISNAHLFPIYCIVIVASELILTGSGDNSLALISKNEVIDRGVHEGQINSIALWQKLVASGGDDQKVIIWKLTNI